MWLIRFCFPFVALYGIVSENVSVYNGRAWYMTVWQATALLIGILARWLFSIIQCVCVCGGEVEGVEVCLVGGLAEQVCWEHTLSFSGAILTMTSAFSQRNIANVSRTFLSHRDSWNLIMPSLLFSFSPASMSPAEMPGHLLQIKATGPRCTHTHTHFSKDTHLSHRTHTQWCNKCN